MKMRENLGLTLDMSKDYTKMGQTFHIAEKMSHKALMVIVNTAAMVLITKAANGVTQENVLMREPVLLYKMFDVLTDFDLTEYQNREEDSVVSFYDDMRDFKDTCIEFYSMYSEVCDAYDEVANEIRRQAKEENKIGPLLRAFGSYMDGDGTQKDIGLIRKMLTDLFIKQNKPEQKEDKNNDNPESNVIPMVDLSKYKVKKDK